MGLAEDQQGECHRQGCDRHLPQLLHRDQSLDRHSIKELHYTKPRRLVHVCFCLLVCTAAHDQRPVTRASYRCPVVAHVPSVVGHGTALHVTSRPFVSSSLADELTHAQSAFSTGGHFV